MPRLVLQLAWPAVMVSLLQTSVLLADTIMVGRFDQLSLAAMQICGPLMWSFSSVLIAFVAGCVPLIARAVGAKDLARAQACARVALRHCVVLGLCAGTVCSLSAPTIAGLMCDDPALVDLASGYLRISFASLPIQALAMTSSMSLNAAGEVRTPFVVGIVTTVANIALNAMLIWGGDFGAFHCPPLGLVGAALGTSLSMALGTLLLLAAMHRPSSSVCIVGWLRREPTIWSQMGVSLRTLSAPIVLERLAIHIGFLAYVRVITTLGAEAMAANEALIGLEAICFTTADGFGVASATIVGQLLGRGRPQDAAKGGWSAALACALVLATLGVLIFANATSLLSLFVEQGDTQKAVGLTSQALTAIPIFALAQPAMAIAVVLGQGLRGAGDTWAPFGVALGGAVLVRLSGAIICTQVLHMSVDGIWAASTLDWYARALILALLWSRGGWSRAKLDRVARS